MYIPFLYIIVMNLQLRIPNTIQKRLWNAVVALTDRFPVLFPHIQYLYAALCVPFFFVGKQKRIFFRCPVSLPVYRNGKFKKVIRFKENDSITITEAKRLLRAKNNEDTVNIISRYPALFYIL